MAWKHISSLATNIHIKRGLQASILAGVLCKEAEKLYPDMFHAISLKQGRMHIEIEPSKLVSFKLIEGQLLTSLQAYSKKHGLPAITGFTLTLSQS
jgi:hypothetical protein